MPEVCKQYSSFKEANMEQSKYKIEIATADYATTKTAVEGGADRIELCADLHQGGTTQSYGTIRRCREAFDVELFPIIRPRGGDFLYSVEEFDIMLQEIGLCKDLGCDGVVLGLLNRDGTIDLKRTEQLINRAFPMEVTFHRAFDRCRDPFAALEELIRLGCQRVLTSGQRPTAPEGEDLIAELIKVAQDRIVIMPGSGVRKENIRELAQKTGAVEFHSSLRSRSRGGMEFIHPSFPEEDYQSPFIDPAEVKALRSALSH
jgi:copper homeostasis protein